MSLRAANVPYLIKSLGGRIDALPGYYLDKFAPVMANERARRAQQARKERARAKASTPK
jgi:hypothetical protein